MPECIETNVVLSYRVENISYGKMCQTSVVDFIYTHTQKIHRNLYDESCLRWLAVQNIIIT